jgi:hypothetical protein
VSGPQPTRELLEASPAQPVELHLRNQLDVSIRAVTTEDELSVLQFLAGLREVSRSLRFFRAGVDLRAEAHRGAAGDDVDRHGVLAIAPKQGVVGQAAYVRVPDSEWAQVAVEVVDDPNRAGLATALLIRLAQIAESRQITSSFAEVPPENRDMLAVFKDGFGARTVGRNGEVDVLFAASSWRRAAQVGPVLV